MDKYVSADIGFLKILEERDGFKQKVELRLLNTLVNRNNWKYVNLEAHRRLFAETPILVAYVGKKIGDGHNFKKIKTEDGTEAASFMDSTAERIVGWFKDEEDIRIETIDGTEWIVGTGFIWVWYAQELVAKLKEQGLDGMSVSIETLVYEMHKDGDVEVFTKYGILGTTILGDDVNPAVKGANIRALSALGEQGVHELTLKVASAQEQGKNPQNTNKKGEKTMKIFNVEDLRDKFSGYTVLAVNESNVALLSDKGRLATYSFKGEEETVIPENIKTVASNCVLPLDDGKEMAISGDIIVSAMKERLNATQTALAQETARANELQTKLNQMEANEKARRIEVVKNAIKDQMNANNANRECAIDEAICKDLEDKAEEYACMENANGEWIGEAEIRKEVDSRCMKAIREQSAVKANVEKRTYAWEIAGEKGKASGEKDGLGSILEQYDN